MNVITNEENCLGVHLTYCISAINLGLNQASVGPLRSITKIMLRKLLCILINMIQYLKNLHFIFNLNFTLKSYFLVM